jgi:hypothetical protein
MVFVSLNGGASQLDYAGRYGTFQHLRSTSALTGETMAGAKTATLTFRIEPGLKEALRTAAEREHRSIANMVEVMIREYCRTKGIAIPEGGVLPWMSNRTNHQQEIPLSMTQENQATESWEGSQ